MINPLELPNCVLLDKSTLPAIPAIYFVVEESVILYVGSTLNLKQRWYSHHKYEVIVKNYSQAKIYFYCVDNLDTLRSLETFFINELSPVLNSSRVFKISKCKNFNAKKSKRLNVIISSFHRLQLKKWSKAHGKTLSAYAAQLITEHIQTNLDLIDNLATRQAEALGMTKEDWINSIAGSPEK